jgi:hypothetical protein
MCVLAGLCIGATTIISVEDVGLWAIPVFAFLVIVGPWLVREPFRLFLWFVVTAPLLSFYVLVRMPVGIPDIIYDRIILLILFAIVLTKAIFFDTPLPKLSFFVIAYLAVTVLGQLRLFVLGGMAEGETSRIIGVLVPLAVYWLTKYFLVSQSRLRWLLASLVASTLFICWTGLIEQVLNVEYSIFAYSSDFTPRPRYLDVPGGRAAGVMTSPGVYGATLGMGLLVGLVGFLQTNRGPIRLLLGAIIVLLAYGVFASYTRGAWVAVLAGLLFAQFYVKNLRKPLLLMTACCIVAAGFLYNDLRKNDVVQERVMESDNVVGRYERIVFGWNCFLEKPIFGWGSGGYNSLIANSREYGVGGFSSSHNSLMTMFVDGGLVQAVSFFALLLFWLNRAHAVARSIPLTSLERYAAIAFAGFVVIWVFLAMSSELRYFSYFNALLWMAGGVIERLAKVFLDDEETADGESARWNEGLPSP